MYAFGVNSKHQVKLINDKIVNLNEEFVTSIDM